MAANRVIALVLYYFIAVYYLYVCFFIAIILKVYGGGGPKDGFHVQPEKWSKIKRLLARVFPQQHCRRRQGANDTRMSPKFNDLFYGFCEATIF